MTTLYQNATVLTMDDRLGATNALLVDGGRIAAVGAAAIAQADGAEVVDLGGATVVPGMIDAHTHLETSAIANNVWVDVRFLSNADALTRIRERVDSSRPGEWVVAQGTYGQDFDMPTRAELDALAPRNPVLFRATMHSQIANTRALELSGLRDHRHSPVGVVVMREPGGEPTGEVIEGFHLFPIDMPGPDEHAEIIEKEIRERFNRYGVTTIYEVPFSAAGVRAFQQLNRDGRLNARISLNPTTGPGLQMLIGDISQWAMLGLMTGFGDDTLWLGGAKFFLDGVHELALSIDRDRLHPAKWGTATRQFNELVRQLVTCYEAKVQPWIHTLGDDSHRLAVDAVREAQRLFGGDGGVRTRIEHIFNSHPHTADLMDEVAELGIVPILQSAFMHFDKGDGAFFFRSLAEKGVPTPGSSDNAGTQPFATNPWFGIGKMLTRRSRNGVIVNPSEIVSTMDGIRSYTRDGAFAGHKEGFLGRLRPGFAADFAVLDQDPLTIPDQDLESIESVLTVMGGRVVWQG